MLTALLRRVRESLFLKDTAILTGGTVVAQIVNLASLPLLSRLYSPADFGQLAVFLVIATISATVVTLRYEVAVMLPKEEAEAGALAALSATLALSIGIFLALVVAVLPRDLRSAFGIASLDTWAAIAVLTGSAMAVGTVSSAWLNRLRRYRLISGLRVGQVCAAAGIALLCGAVSVPNGLILAQIAGFGLLALFATWGASPALFSADRDQMLRAAKTHRASPIYLLPSAVLDTVSMQLPILLIAAWFSTDDAGQFSMAWRILWLPISLVGVAAGQVFYQRFSTLVHEPAAARLFLLKNWLMLTVIGSPIALTIMLFGVKIFTTALGSAWIRAGEISQIIAPMLLFLLIVGPTSSALIALGMQRHSLWFGLSSFVYRPLTIWIGYTVGDLYFGLFLYVIVEISQILLYQLAILLGLRSRAAAARSS